MLNSVGLQGPGVAAWLDDELPGPGGHRGPGGGQHLGAHGWRTSPRPPALLAGAPGVVAVEVNVSCPNLEDRSRMFAHSATATAEAVAAAAAAGLPRWAKLSPNVADLVEIAGAALDAGAEALTLVNTLLGMAIDLEHRRPVARGRRRRAVGSGHPPGGRAGRLRVPGRLPRAGIVGVGGVHAAPTTPSSCCMAGADAVAGGHGHLPRPPGAVEGARRARAVVPPRTGCESRATS